MNEKKLIKIEKVKECFKRLNAITLYVKEKGWNILINKLTNDRRVLLNSSC